MNQWWRATGPPTPRALAAGLVASSAIGLLARQRGSLTGGGAAGAALIGTAVFAAGGPVPSALLLTFFGSSSALSRWRRGEKAALFTVAAKGAQRDFVQTLANGGVAALVVASSQVWPRWPWLAALVGTLATVNADTWATELGTLTQQPPRLLTTFRQVPAGTSGAISLPGSLAALAGATTIGAVAAVGQRLTTGRWRSGAALLSIGAVAGVAGCLSDSLLGATVQARYYCGQCAEATEQPIHRCGAQTTLIGGLAALNNDSVNALAALSGALVGVALARSSPNRW